VERIPGSSGREGGRKGPSDLREPAEGGQILSIEVAHHAPDLELSLTRWSERTAHRHGFHHPDGVGSLDQRRGQGAADERFARAGLGGSEKETVDHDGPR
jgi:hypothetical protein